ncbi:MAG: hypothetical protein JW861_06750 [Bacteroidales bacterium]|nr:hypothetical protein [Bacteroidales bacterium]
MKAKTAFAGLSMMMTLFMGSCTTDENNDVTPADDRDQFLGSWNVNETCQRDAYSVEIIRDPSNSSQVIIRNFWLIGYNEKAPYAIVAGSSIVIPEQTMCDNNSNEVSGSGTLDKNRITWNYTVNDGADLWTCSATYEKQ